MRWMLGFAVVALLVITGCTATPERPEEPAPAVADEAPDFMIAVTEKLGPVPPRPVYTPEQEEQARLAAGEASWARVLDQFADATRPAADFLHYADGREYPPAQVECLAGRGVAANLAYSAKGLVGGYDLDIGPGEEKAAAVAAWACDVQYPQHPRPPFTGEELGYLYDYFVEFKVPCLEAAGHPQEDAPTREYFVGNWPQQGWYPSASIEQLDSPEWDVIEAACPNAPRGIG